MAEEDTYTNELYQQIAALLKVVARTSATLYAASIAMDVLTDRVTVLEQRMTALEEVTEKQSASIQMLRHAVNDLTYYHN